MARKLDFFLKFCLTFSLSAQVVSMELGIGLDQISIKSSNSFVGNNNAITTGSRGSELTCSAAIKGCDELVRLRPNIFFKLDFFLSTKLNPRMPVVENGPGGLRTGGKRHLAGEGAGLRRGGDRPHGQGDVSFSPGTST